MWRRERDTSPLNAMLTDAWLLRRFPGKTLEELDTMDWGRYLRAVEVQQVIEVEQDYKAFLTQKITELPAAAWRIIRAHEELLNTHGNR